MKPLLFVTISILLFQSCSSTNKEKPNVIIIFTDDQGYQDLGCFGSPDIKTPQIDKLAGQGIKLTDFYVTASVCTPSRASLMTGRYSVRTGIIDVILPDEEGMRPSEVTIAEMLKEGGYRSACYGKWHLGDLEPGLPTNQGFDEYFGIPYSNGMGLGELHDFSESALFQPGYTLEKVRAYQEGRYDEIEIEMFEGKDPLFEGTEVVEFPADWSMLTKRYFERAIRFINESENNPFFLYITPAMPHVPLAASEQFKGTSKGGLYGDVIEEIDWNVGRLILHLEENGLLENTMVIFTSDNGPWLRYGEDGGHAEPLRDGKFSAYEGGVRVPCVMYWKGKWESGKVSNTPISTIDLLPTIAHYAGVPLPDVPIDGVNIAYHLENTEVAPDRDYILFNSEGHEICGIRMGEWKFLPFGGYPDWDDNAEPELYNLEDDISETNNIYEQHPELVERFTEVIEDYYEQAVRSNFLENVTGTVEYDVIVPMRDGVGLATDVYIPEGEGPFPVIIERTPYGRGGEEGEGFMYTEDGYVAVIQNVRGTGNSGGEWEPFVNERMDGLDTHAWILEQPWCNGKIGTTGGSYTGLTEWAIAAHSGPSHKVMFAGRPLLDAYHDLAYIGGAFGLGTLMHWGSVMARPVREEEEVVDLDSWDWDQAYRRLPLSEWDQNLGYEIPYMRNWIEHDIYDAYWETAGISNDLLDVDVPCIIETGWNDVFINQTFKYVSYLRKHGRHELGRMQYVICGPIGHGGEDDRDYGDEWDFDTAPLRNDWFAYWLKDGEMDLESIPPYRLFVMGRNEWRLADEWPLPETQFTPWYFHSGGSANTLKGDGTLNTTKPGDQPVDTYTYDPDDPVPTTGGAHLAEAPIGAYDQRPVELREDVLVYTSAPLDEEVEVTGPVRVILYAASSARDTDWTAKLVDVAPNGTAFNICDGVQRARWREGGREPSWIEPGEVYRYEIDLWVTSNAFLPGHRIRVEISSSNFPRFDRNPNTGNHFGRDTELMTAEQTVYHNKVHPSHIILPVIPN
jgi:putative CocE/NonD family hydrolase